MADGSHVLALGWGRGDGAPLGGWLASVGRPRSAAHPCLTKKWGVGRVRSARPHMSTKSGVEMDGAPEG